MAKQKNIGQLALLAILVLGIAVELGSLKPRRFFRTLFVILSSPLCSGEDNARGPHRDIDIYRSPEMVRRYVTGRS